MENTLAAQAVAIVNNVYLSALREQGVNVSSEAQARTLEIFQDIYNKSLLHEFDVERMTFECAGKIKVIFPQSDLTHGNVEEFLTHLKSSTLLIQTIAVRMNALDATQQRDFVSQLAKKATAPVRRY